MFGMDSVEHPIIAKYNNLLEGNSKSEIDDYYKQSISDLTPLNMTPPVNIDHGSRNMSTLGKNQNLFTGEFDDSVDQNNLKYDQIDEDSANLAEKLKMIKEL